jgi:isopenicillin N synthase-like dioxygenase
LTKEVHEKLPELFNLPDDVKDKCNMINSPSFLGYTRLGAETTASQTDLREVLTLCVLIPKLTCSAI